jgi:hypothetical protein
MKIMRENDSHWQHRGNLGVMLSKRAKRALDLLAQGAEFVCRIERDPTTDIKHLKYRVILDGQVIPDLGVGTFNELRNAGYLISSEESSVSSHYKLKQQSSKE